MDYSIWQDMVPAEYVAFLGAFLVLALIMLAALYIYNSIVWMTIGKKLNYKYPWLAWIPVANIAMLLQLGGFGWGWVFLILVPILGWIALAVLGIISTWKVFEKRKYPGWLSLVPILGGVPMIGGLASIAFLVILGLVAWKDN